MSWLHDSTTTSTRNRDWCRRELGSAMRSSRGVLVSELNTWLGTSRGAVGGVAVGAVGADGDRALATVVSLSVDSGGAVRNGGDGHGGHDVMSAVQRRYRGRLCMACGGRR